MKSITSAIRPRRRRLTSETQQNAHENQEQQQKQQQKQGVGQLPSKEDSASEEAKGPLSSHYKKFYAQTKFDKVPTASPETKNDTDEPISKLHGAVNAAAAAAATTGLALSSGELQMGIAAANYFGEQPLRQNYMHFQPMHYQPLYEENLYSDGVPLPSTSLNGQNQQRLLDRYALETERQQQHGKLKVYGKERSHSGCEFGADAGGGDGDQQLGKPANVPSMYAHEFPIQLWGADKRPWGLNSAATAVKASQQVDSEHRTLLKDCLTQNTMRNQSLPPSQIGFGITALPEGTGRDFGSSASDTFSNDTEFLKRTSSTPGNLSLFRTHLYDPFRHPEFRAPPRYTRHQPVRLPTNEPDSTPLYGYGLLALTASIFMFSMYSLIVSKFIPDTGIAFLDAIKYDRYFCLLMPITGLSFTVAVFWNWIGMKFFRHN